MIERKKDYSTFRNSGKHVFGWIIDSIPLSRKIGNAVATNVVGVQKATLKLITIRNH
jgi:hypothetical protein